MVSIAEEMGSNQSKGLGFIGMDELKKEFQKYANKVETDAIQAAIYAAAEVFKDALTAATPVGTKAYNRKSTSYKSKGKRHLPGTAKRNVIIYQRKQPRGVLSISNLDLALLVGYAKEEAYYMYWYEKGRKGQEARKFTEAVYDTSYVRAMNEAVRVLKARMANA